MWDGVGAARGKAFCGHSLTSHLTHSEYALIEQLSNYICASQVSDQHNAFPKMKCETFFFLTSPEKIITENHHQGGSGVRVWSCRNMEDLIFKARLVTH